MQRLRCLLPLNACAHADQLWYQTGNRSSSSYAATQFPYCSSCRFQRSQKVLLIFCLGPACGTDTGTTWHHPVWSSERPSIRQNIFAVPVSIEIISASQITLAAVPRHWTHTFVCLIIRWDSDSLGASSDAFTRYPKSRSVNGRFNELPALWFPFRLEADFSMGLHSLINGSETTDERKTSGLIRS